MRILVTGAAGFIGSLLCPELAGRGHKVIEADMLQGDLRSPLTIQRLLIEERPQMVVHLAARPGRLFGEQDAGHTISSNVTATANVARACGKAGVRLCYFSSSEVYGNCFSLGLASESSLLGRPTNLYGLTKRWGEDLVQLYTQDPLVIRLSMPYGPTQKTGVGRAALPTFIQRALEQLPITVHRGSERSWCYVDDAIRGCADVIERGQGTFNVGRDDDYRSMMEIAELACKLAGADPQELIEVREPPEISSPLKRLSMGRLRSLGWEPRVSLEEGMMRVMDALSTYDLSRIV